MILKGDCIEVMKAIKPNSVDAIVTDPPYGLEFMGKKWDKLWHVFNKEEKGTRLGSDGVTRTKISPFSLHHKTPEYKSGLQMQLWHTQWLTEVYRVLKPGGSMLVMGGTRTFHRLACAIEDSGFIIKDTLMWLYGSGFPKAQDLGKMIDKRGGKEREVIGIKSNHRNRPQTNQWKKSNSIAHGNPFENRDGHLIKHTIPTTDLAKHWDGFKVGGIKPAYEPIIWAVKPPEGSYVDNVLKWGVGAVNVDECRISTSDDVQCQRSVQDNKNVYGDYREKYDGKGRQYQSKGRFPANVILSHHPECVQVGMKRVISNARKNKGGMKIKRPSQVPLAEHDGISWGNLDGYEQVESWDCHPDCAVRLLDEQSGDLKSGTIEEHHHSSRIYGRNSYFDSKTISKGKRGIGDSGGASRFFYCAKASRGERNAGLEGMEEKERAGINKMMGNEKGGESMKTGSGNIRNNKLNNSHPCVKPIKLFEWLIKLVTREGQIVLDAFIGSGTTAIAAHNTGRKCIGIEKEDEYLEIAKRRISYWQNQPKQNSLNLGE